VIVMTTPNGAYFRNGLPKFSDCADPAVYEKVQFKPNADGHIFLLHPEEVPVLGTRAGLVLEELSLCANPLTCGHIKTAPLLRILPAWAVEGLEGMSQRLPAVLRRKALTQIVALFRKPTDVASPT
jgi:2-polyprenyl-6-hydroxyphenyl methylase/3-demethylubiquinone-9 3-methyltransferase